MLHVVTGPPCAGKTTYVSEHRAPDDVVVDLDAIASALGATDRHEYSGPIRDAAFAARRAAIDSAAASGGDAWVIHSRPTAEQREGYKGATYHDLDPGMDEALRRADADGRPSWTAQAIRDWYAKSAPQGAFFIPARREPEIAAPTHGGERSIVAPTPAGAGKGGPDMADNTAVEQGTDNTPQGAEPEEAATTPRTFTQEEVNAIVEKRIARVKATPPADYEELQAKAARLDELEEANKSELEKATAKLEKATATAADWQAKYEALQAENARAAQVRDLAAQYGVDADMLARMSGDVEENAKYLADRAAKAPKFGSLHDGGEQPPTGMTLEEIERIANPTARIRARAEYYATHNK